MEQSNIISFKGQNIYVGIDVHLKSWSVTILSETSVLKKMSQGADPDALHILSHCYNVGLSVFKFDLR